MPRVKKINTETKNTEKPKRKRAEVKKVNAEIITPVAENIYSTLRTDSNGVKELVIDWDKLREHVRHSVQ